MALELVRVIHQLEDWCGLLLASPFHMLMCPCARYLIKILPMMCECYLPLDEQVVTLFGSLSHQCIHEYVNG